MSELWIPTIASVASAVSEVASHDLTRRTAVLAGRLADVVQRTGDDDPGILRAADFLREWAASVGSGPPLILVGGPGHDLPLDRLATRLELTSAEVDLVLLAGLAEEHEGVAQTLRALHPAGEPRPSVGLAAHVLAGQVDRTALHRLLQEGIAVSAGVLGLDGDGPFYERSLRVADGLWAVLHGHQRLPESLVRLPVRTAPPGLDRWAATLDAVRAVRVLRAGRPQVLHLVADDATVGLSRCMRLACDAGTDVLAARLPAYDAPLVTLLGLHAMARGAVPVLVGPFGRTGAEPPVDLPEPYVPLFVVAPAGGVRPAPGSSFVSVPSGPVDVEDRRAAWRAAVPHLPHEAPRLAARYPLDPAWTAQIAEDLRLQERLVPGAGAVPDAIRRRVAASLPPGVTLLTPHEGWDRIVLDLDQRTELEQAVNRMADQALVLDDWGVGRVARANRGVRLLFTGPPGTGKSLAAEVVATALEADLLVVDVSHVVSKWLGETAKNLAAVFDAAERSQAVLLLDEADALFASRTEIADAHDRYANLDTAYLLQRMDVFDGLVALTTNLRQNIDAAFLRRMDHVVEFGLPDRHQRLQLWEQHLPSGIRGEDVDLAHLASRYAVPGAMIRNASIAAAFLAAAQEEWVGQRHLVESVRREYAKAGKPFPGESSGGATGDPQAIRALEQASRRRPREDTT